MLINLLSAACRFQVQAFSYQLTIQPPTSFSSCLAGRMTPKRLMADGSDRPGHYGVITADKAVSSPSLLSHDRVDGKRHQAAWSAQEQRGKPRYRQADATINPQNPVCIHPLIAPYLRILAAEFGGVRSGRNLQHVQVALLLKDNPMRTERCNMDRCDSPGALGYLLQAATSVPYVTFEANADPHKAVWFRTG